MDVLGVYLTCTICSYSISSLGKGGENVAAGVGTMGLRGAEHKTVLTGL